MTCFTYSANAQITEVSGGTGAHIVNSGSSVSPTIGTVAENDVVLVPVYYGDSGNNGTSISGVTGYTQLIAPFASADGGDSDPTLYAALYCKVAGASEGNPAANTAGEIGAGDVLSAGVIVIRGALQDCSTIVAHSVTSVTDITGNIDTSALTITTDDTIVYAFGGTTSNWTSVAPVSWASAESYEYSTAAGVDVGHTAAHVVQSTAANISADEFVITDEANSTQPELSIVVSLKPAAAAAAPTITSALDCSTNPDTDGFECTITADEDSTGHFVAWPINQTAPSDAQLKAGSGDTIEYETVALTGSMEGSVHFEGLAGRAVYDVYAIASNAAGDSSQSTDLDSFRGARTGYEFITLTSIGAGTWCAQANTADYWDNAGLAIAIGDVLEIQTATSPGAFAVTNGVDCGLSYSGNGSRQTVSECPLDATTGANFADPMLSPAFYEGCDDLIVFNNAAPQGGAEPYIDVWLSGAAITDIDLDTVFSDGDGDSMTYEVTTGTLPAGVSLSTNLLTGTPTTSNYPDGVSVTITAYDSFGGSGTQEFDLWVYDAAELTMPDLTDGDINDAISDELSTMPWREDPTLTTTFACDESVASGTFISQDPAATTQIDPDQVFSGVVSTGECTGGGAMTIGPRIVIQ